MKGTSFTLFYVISVLFIISHIWFTMFITTFMKKASHGRIITVVLLVLALFFANLHNGFTLAETNSSEAVKHIFSIIPLSAYEMALISFYEQCRLSYPPLQWSDANRSDLSYRPWYAIFWLSLDSLIFFLLFSLCNLVLPRDFGSPPLAWSDLFRLSAWRRLLVTRTAPFLAGSKNLIDIADLHKTYTGIRDIVALSGVSLTIDAGEIVVVIGPNGAGKSTLMNILAGAVEPTAGTLHLDGIRQRFRDIRRHLGVCFQENVLIGLLTIREHFTFFGILRQLSDEDIACAMSFFADTLQLGSMLETRACDLSGGQKRKLCIALALLGGPPIVIMDEPTAGVDVQARQLIWKTIAQLKGTTTIVTSHALEEAEAVSSRLFVVAGGKIPFAGTSTELRNQFKCGYVLRFDGDTERIRQAAAEIVPGAQFAGRADMIEMPVCPQVPEFMRWFEGASEQLGVRSWSFAIEQLEDVLLKLIETEEAQYSGRAV
jgi:ABC-type multidrug transport system ATPase subunit